VNVAETDTYENRTAGSLGDAGGVTVAELVGALRRQQGLRDSVRATQPVPALGVVRKPPNCRQLEVMGAHSAAGTTTVAVAVAEALAARHDPADGAEAVTLIGGAALSSGLAGASRCEVASPAPGWRAGRRGAVDLRWPAKPIETCEAPEGPVNGWAVADVGLNVLDGAPPRSETPSGPLVLVCRATVPGVRAAELRLGPATRVDAVVVVGARRWPREVRACLGPSLRDLDSAGQVVFVPADRQLLLGGLDGRPLSGCVARAAGAVLGVLWPEEFRSLRMGRGRGRV